MALTELGLIDEYEFVVHPRMAGHGPTLFAGLSKHVDLKLVGRLEFGSGAVAMRYRPRKVALARNIQVDGQFEVDLSDERGLLGARRSSHISPREWIRRLYCRCELNSAA